ncbi:polysaccharide deacetylase family protein [Ideonella sp. BN130291]|uniref:polysaccharide deacetylase family protein n=1 Tax=Ideonella sp. BN130291 TaxID=3112940 RepID=UPI002E2598BC|nr:polysaccharide deacetylase family protein [Ideonella sp. BN130291]
MLGKKAMLGSALGGSGIATARLKLGPARHNELLILAYHRVCDLDDEQTLARDPELVSASVSDFEQQMRFVREHFTPLRFADVIECLDSGRPLPPRSLVVTFDDGHLDDYTHAFPVLKALGVPACIFLSTDYVGSTQMFWFDRVALLLYGAPAGRWQIGGHLLELAQDDVAARRAATRKYLRTLKSLPDHQRVEGLNMLEQLFGAGVPAAAVPARSALNWDEVREMARNGIEFGSHTCSHPILTRLDDASLKRELTESRRIIGEQLRRPVDVVAYPVGKSDAFDARVMAMSQGCGYRLGVSYETGTNTLARLEHFALRRLPVERYTELRFFKSLLAFPALLA